MKCNSAFTEDIELTCDCSWGDGWHGGYLEINGQRYFDSFAFQERNSIKSLYSPVDIAKHSLLASPHLKLLAGLLNRENWIYC